MHIFAATLIRHRKALEDWIARTDGLGRTPEPEEVYLNYPTDYRPGATPGNRNPVFEKKHRTHAPLNEGKTDGNKDMIRRPSVKIVGSTAAHRAGIETDNVLSLDDQHVVGGLKLPFDDQERFLGDHQAQFFE